METNATESATILFYIDDSGTRHPDHDLSDRERDWFALGGIMIDEKDKTLAEQLILDFRTRWPESGNAPFHSREIRRKEGGFTWLGRDTKRAGLFLGHLTELLLELPVIGLAYLWPMCLGGYDTKNKAYRALIEANKLIDCSLSPEDMAERGIKYSCFKNAQVPET